MTLRTLLHTGAAGIAALGMVSCDTESNAEADSSDAADTSLADVTTQAGEAAETAGDYINDKIKETRKDMNAQLQKVNAKIDQLQAKAEELEADARIKANKAVENLKTQRDAVQNRITELKADSADALTTVKEGISNAIDEIDKSVDKALAEF